MNRSFYSLSHNYIYSDTNDALAPNQFELRYQIIHSEPFAARTYTVPYWVEIPEDAEAKPFIIPLSDFGYYKQGRFVPLYEGDSEKEGDWNIAIDLDSVSDTGRKLTLDREITIGDYRFQMEDVQLTPLACTVRLDCLEDESVIVGTPPRYLTLTSQAIRAQDSPFRMGSGRPATSTAAEPGETISWFSNSLSRSTRAI